MSIGPALEDTARILREVTVSMGTTVLVERRPDPKHSAPVNPDLTVDNTWAPVYPQPVPAIVVVGGTNGTGLPMEGKPGPGEWQVTFLAEHPDVVSGDRVTVAVCRDPRLVNRQAMVGDVLDTSAAVAHLVSAREV